ncbi:hypothetical protein D3C80_1781410 [compost metagenome]
MNKFEIDIYKHIIYFSKGCSRRVSFPNFLRAIGKDDASLNEKSAIASLIHDDDFKKVLHQVGVNLWIGHDHLIRAVDTLSMKGTQEVGNGLCRLCLGDESDPRELVRVGDASWVHHLCRERYEKMRECRRSVGVELDGE